MNMTSEASATEQVNTDTVTPMINFTPIKIANKVGVITVGLKQHYAHPELFLIIPQVEGKKDYKEDVIAAGGVLAHISEFLIADLMIMSAGDISPKGAYFSFTKGEQNVKVLAAPYITHPDFRKPTPERMVITMVSVTDEAFNEAREGKIVDTLHFELN